MEDWIGLSVIALLVLSALVGLKLLSKEKKSTEQEFEKGAAESASFGGAVMNVLNGMLNPGSKTGEKAVVEYRQQARRKKRGDGNANREDENEDKND